MKKKKNTVEFIICWSTTPEHEACPGVVDMPNITLLEIFPLPADISDKSVYNLCPRFSLVN